MVKLLFPSIRTYVVLHGSEVNLRNLFLRLFTHKCISRADVLIPVSQFTKSLLPDWLLKNHSSIHVIPNGIEMGSCQEVHTNVRCLKGNPVLLTVGHVSFRKGQHRVIKALPELIRQFPDIHYHVVGRPVLQQEFEQLANDLGVLSHITFHGRVEKHSDLARFYNGSDLFMLLSENQPNGDVEGFGIVALEANQYGLPVVGALGSGVEEAVSHQISGLLVNGDDCLAIKQAVVYCLDNRDELNAGSKSWASQHQWSSIIQQYLPLLN
jgi:phosphatidylinositol alpha-1,6-mannosyltransferase